MIEIKKADNQFKTENNINYEAYKLEEIYKAGKSAW